MGQSDVGETVTTPSSMGCDAQNIGASLQHVWPVVPGREQVDLDDAQTNAQYRAETVDISNRPSSNMQDERMAATQAQDIAPIVSSSTQPGASALWDEGSKPLEQQRIKVRASDKNRAPCSSCQLLQKKCTVVCEQPRLCNRCQKKGLEECPPHTSRRNGFEKASDAPFTELAPFTGVFRIDY